MNCNDPLIHSMADLINIKIKEFNTEEFKMKTAYHNGELLCLQLHDFEDDRLCVYTDVLSVKGDFDMHFVTEKYEKNKNRIDLDKMFELFDLFKKIRLESYELYESPYNYWEKSK